MELKIATQPKVNWDGKASGGRGRGLKGLGGQASSGGVLKGVGGAGRAHGWDQGDLRAVVICRGDWVESAGALLGSRRLWQDQGGSWSPWAVGKEEAWGDGSLPPSPWDQGLFLISPNNPLPTPRCTIPTCPSHHPTYLLGSQY